MRLFHQLLLLSLLLLAVGCKNKGHSDEPARNGAFAKAKQTEGPNLQRIIDSGELIVATISGPDTYFDYQGQPMGLQYALCEDFASTLGVGVRVVLAPDTAQLLRQVETGEADLAALPLPTGSCAHSSLCFAGYTNKEKTLSWALRSEATDLAEALNDWYNVAIEARIRQREKQRFTARHTVKRQVHAPFISREKGIISTYDALFKEAARQIGWDWRLIAAQCYQESAFDPNAVSWAGAKGLMQIMPATAAHLGLPEESVYNPQENIEAGARFLGQLQSLFSDIPQSQRANFVLASYIGGSRHIRDAVSLTKKYGGNPYNWNEVSQYVLKLTDPKYYQDPVAPHGYMRGNETVEYVRRIQSRYAQYCGFAAPGNFASQGMPQRARKHHRFK